MSNISVIQLSHLDTPEPFMDRPRNLTVAERKGKSPKIDVGSPLPKHATVHLTDTKRVQIAEIKKQNSLMRNEANVWANKTQVITSPPNIVSSEDRLSTREMASLQPSQPRASTRRTDNGDIANMINSTYRGKENLTLKPYLRTYENVQENVKAIN